MKLILFCVENLSKKKVNTDTDEKSVNFFVCTIANLPL